MGLGSAISNDLGSILDQNFLALRANHGLARSIGSTLANSTDTVRGQIVGLPYQAHVVSSGRPMYKSNALHLFEAVK